MKASELRLGNIYNYKGNIITFNIDDFSELKYNLLELIKPIPLTKECLIDFGFKFDDCKGFDRVDNLKVYSLRNFDIAIEDGEFYLWIEVDEDSWYNLKLIEIKHVHQLQNLYFALTGEELTLKK